MSNLKFKPEKSNPNGKPKVYFCCHKEDFEKFFESISDEILSLQNCTVWYKDGNDYLKEELLGELKGMQLFVMPVTTNLLCTENDALDIEFKFAIKNHIPVLPLMQEQGLEQIFNQKCGELQFLDKYNTDITAISYEGKLKKYLESVLIGDEMAEKIRAAFDAYVFLSYRKKDRKYAQELMRLIHKNEFCRDIAIWYDEFLTPGENFNESIKEALQKSGLFVLTVTPSLLEKVVDDNGEEKDNYIITTEYPMAKQEGKPILPAELVSTDREELSQKYEDIPAIADAHNDSELSDALLESIKKMAIKENDKNPEHNFFIGLAYLGGVDVEVDHEKALSLITLAAEAGLVEANEKLVDMYLYGNGVERDYGKANKFSQVVLDLSKSLYDSEPQKYDLLYANALFSRVFVLNESATLEINILEELCTKAVTILEEHKSDPSHETIYNLMNAYYKLACIHRRNFNIEKADEFYLKGINISKKIEDTIYLEDKIAIAHLYFDYATYMVGFSSEKDIGIILTYLNKALELFNEISQTRFYFIKYVKETENVINIVNNNVDSIDKNRRILADDVDEDVAKKYYSFRYFFERGDNSEKEKNFDKAILNYKSCLRILESLDGKENIFGRLEKADVYDRLAVCYESLKDLEEAKTAYLQAIYEAVKELKESSSDEAFSAAVSYTRKLASFCDELGYKEEAQKHYRFCDFLVEERKRQDSSNVEKNLDELETQIVLGKTYESNDHLSKAQETYINALKFLDGLSETEQELYLYIRADLCRRIGNILLLCENIEYAKIFFDRALWAIEGELIDRPTDDSYRLLSIILDKLAEVTMDFDERRKYYSQMYDINLSLFEKNQDEESSRQLAYSIFKLAFIDKDNPNRKMLKSAYKIWKTLYKSTGNEDYKNLYKQIEKIL